MERPGLSSWMKHPTKMATSPNRTYTCRYCGGSIIFRSRSHHPILDEKVYGNRIRVIHLDGPCPCWGGQLGFNF